MLKPRNFKDMAKRKNSIAWVRLDGNNAPIPGTLIYRQKKPYGKFAKMTNPAGDLCCAGSGNSCGVPYRQDYVTYTNPDTTSTYYGAISSDSNEECFIYSLGEVGTFDIGFSSQPLVQKQTKDGVVIWSKRLNTTDEEFPDEYISGLKVDPNGDVIVIFDLALVKLSGVDGSIVWQKKYSDRQFPEGVDYYIDYIMNIDFDSDANVYAVGSTNTIVTPELGEKNGFILKVDGTDGTVISCNNIDIATRVTDGAYFSEASDIRVLSDGSIRLVYNTTDFQGTDQEFPCVVASFDSSLTQQWAKGFVGVPIADFPYFLVSTLVVDAAGNTIVPLYYINSVGGNQSSIAKIDASGNLVWINYTTTEGIGINIDVASIDVNGNPIFSTTRTNPDSTYQDRVIAKFSGADGSLMFSYLLGTDNISIGYWWSYTSRMANFVYGNTLYMSSYNYIGSGYIQTFPTDVAINPGTYPASSFNYIVSEFPIETAAASETITTRNLTLTPFTVPVEDTIYVSVNDTFVNHEITNVP